MGAPANPNRVAGDARAPEAPALSLFWHVLPGLLALVLFLVLLAVSDLTLADAHRAFSALTPQTLALFFALTLLLLLLSALKWQRVMAELGGSDRPMPLASAFFYTTIGSALSLVLIPHIASAIGRAAGARLHGDAPPVRAAGASLYEQVFDVAAMLALAAVGLLWLWPQALPWVALGAAIIAAATALAVRGRLPVPARLRPLLGARLFAPRLLGTLLAVSLLRYALVAARALILAAPAGIALTAPDFLAAFSLVQISRLVAVTPMGLGVTDWTWAGVLSLVGQPLAVAAAFVLLSRVLNAAAVLACLALGAVTAMIGRRP